MRQEIVDIRSSPVFSADTSHPAVLESDRPGHHALHWEHLMCKRIPAIILLLFIFHTTGNTFETENARWLESYVLRHIENRAFWLNRIFELLILPGQRGIERI